MLIIKVKACLALCLIELVNAKNQIKEFKNGIKIEGEINNLIISAEFQNNSNSIIVIGYILKINK